MRSMSTPRTGDSLHGLRGPAMLIAAAAMFAAPAAFGQSGQSPSRDHYMQAPERRDTDRSRVRYDDDRYAYDRDLYDDGYRSPRSWQEEQRYRQQFGREYDYDRYDYGQTRFYGEDPVSWQDPYEQPYRGSRDQGRWDQDWWEIDRREQEGWERRGQAYDRDLRREGRGGYEADRYEQDRSRQGRAQQAWYDDRPRREDRGWGDEWGLEQRPVRQDTLYREQDRDSGAGSPNAGQNYVRGRQDARQDAYRQGQWSQQDQWSRQQRGQQDRYGRGSYEEYGAGYGMTRGGQYRQDDPYREQSVQRLQNDRYSGQSGWSGEQGWWEPQDDRYGQQTRSRQSDSWQQDPYRQDRWDQRSDAYRQEDRPQQPRYRSTQQGSWMGQEEAYELEQDRFGRSNGLSGQNQNRQSGQDQDWYRQNQSRQNRDAQGWNQQDQSRQNWNQQGQDRRSWDDRGQEWDRQSSQSGRQWAQDDRDHRQSDRQMQQRGSWDDRSRSGQQYRPADDWRMNDQRDRQYRQGPREEWPMGDQSDDWQDRRYQDDDWRMRGYDDRQSREYRDRYGRPNDDRRMSDDAFDLWWYDDAEQDRQTRRDRAER